MKVHTHAASFLTAHAALILCLLAAGSYGCSHAEAKADLVPEPLTVPMPPPRIIQNADGEVTQPLGVPTPTPGTADSTNRETPPAIGRGTAPAGNASTRPADPPRPGTAAAAAEAPKPPEEPRAPAASPLQTTTSQRETEERNQIQGLIQRATNDLNRVDRARLNTDGKLQYDTATEFIKQGRGYLNIRDFVLARSVATKAATIASQLLSR